MFITKIAGIYTGTLKITGQTGWYSTTGKTRQDVIAILLDYARIGGNIK